MGMKKNVTISVISGFLLTIGVFIIAYFVHIKTYAPPAHRIGDSPPPWWANGIPINFVEYHDCIAGCFPTLQLTNFVLDISIWSVAIYIFLKYYRKKSHA